MKRAPGRGTLEKEKPPILGMIQRGGQVVLKMLANVQQTTIKPIIEAGVAKGALIHTDEYDIYARLPAWGYEHKTVCHGRGEYARDEDGDGFHEIHVDTMEGLWSLLRSWLRPHRGVAQEKLPLYLAFFQFLHNAKKRGKALLTALVGEARRRGLERAHLHAQLHAHQFYRKAGFSDDGETLWDAGILHQPMTLHLTGP